MCNMEQISIVIPVFNTAPALLECCVRSALEQAYANIEIILVDDGSNRESTLNKLLTLSKMDKRIKLVQQQNQGQSVARKTGIDVAAGKYIMFLDSDDVLHSKICEYLLQLIERENCDLAEAAAKEVAGIDEITHSCELNKTAIEWKIQGREPLLDKLIENCELPIGWSVWAKLFKTELLKRSYKVHPDIYRGEDVLTVAEYLCVSEKAIITKQQLYYYNKGNTDSVTTQNSVKNLSLCRFVRELMYICRDYGSKNAYIHSRAMYCEMLSSSYLQCWYNKYENYKGYQKQLKRELVKYHRDCIRNPYVHNRIKIIIIFIFPQLFYLNHLLRKEKIIKND